MVSLACLCLESEPNAEYAVYDEKYLSEEGDPSTAPGSGSELWVIDAKRMHQAMDAVVCRVKLPQRVPYG